MDDELQETRDNFYVGNFAKTLEMCDGSMPGNDFAQAENDALVGRCCLALGQFERLKSMQNSSCPGQKASALTAVMTKSKNEAQRVAAKDRLKELAMQTQDMSCGSLAACASAMEGIWQDAVQMTTAHPTMEMQALRAFILLMCNQANMAEKQIQEMKGAGNDDCSAVRLAQAAVHLSAGNPEEAYLMYCDLATQFPVTDGDDSGNGSKTLLIGKAVANMHRGMFTEAVEDLQRALAVDPNDVDALVNTCCCMTHLGKSAEFKQHFAKLEQLCPTHPYVLKTQSIKTVFGRFNSSLKA